MMTSEPRNAGPTAAARLRRSQCKIATSSCVRTEDVAVETLAQAPGHRSRTCKSAVWTSQGCVFGRHIRRWEGSAVTGPQLWGRCMACDPDLLPLGWVCCCFALQGSRSS